MKKLLPLLKNLLVRDMRSFTMALMLLVLLGIGNRSQAQVYYMTNDATSGSSSTVDGINRMDYNGANATLLANSFTASPGLMEIDLPNNRAFVYEAFSTTPPNGLSIKVVNLTSGAVTATIPITEATARCYAIKYDPINDYIYYVVADSGPTSATTNDALIKVKPDGTGKTVVISGFCKNPTLLALDIANNKAYVYNQLASEKNFLTINLSAGTVAQTITITAPAGNPFLVQDIDYDAETDYIYYLSSNNSGATNANDAISKIHPNGTGYAAVVGVAQAPTFMALDLGNNRAFVFDNVSPARTISSIDLSTGTATVIKSLSSLPGSSTVTSLWVPNTPVLITASATSVSSGTATVGGNVTRSDISVTERGVVYSSSNTVPTIGGSGVVKASNGSGTGSFSGSISGLTGSTTYYLRSYATSGAGTSYGAVTSFTTLSNDATLSGFTISAGTLTPGFSSGTLSYTASVANANSTITVTPTKNNNNASIKVNNVAVTSGTASGAISLNIGDNVITTLVTAQDGITTKTYTLTVSRPKAAQTITFAGIATKTYGDADFAPGASASSGLGIIYSSDNLAVATIISGQVHIVGAGTANITASQAGDGNTLAATNVVQGLTVNKNAITVTATAGQTKVYGNTEPSFAYTITSGTVKSGDSFTGSLSRAAGEDVGLYALAQNTLTLGNNYTLSFVSNNFAITKRAITITPTIKTKVYGDPDPASFSYTTGGMGLANGDGMTGLFERPVGENVGVYNLGLGAKHPVNINSGADQSANYDITFVSNTLTITKRPLTVAPLPVTKVYGQADFASGAPYSFNGTSLASGDGMTGTFGRNNTSENVGVYALTLGNKHPVNIGTGEDVSSNYDISFVTNTFTITAKSIAVNVYSQTKAYGDADPALTYTSAPLEFSDTFSGALTRDAGESVGTYAINQGTLTLGSNYNIIYVGANLTIGTKTINVTAAATTKNYGDADPAFNYTNDALAIGDNFTGSLTRDAGENAGVYAITQGTLALNSNYVINYTGANLSINKATLTYVATPASRPFQTANPTFAGSVTGFVNGDSQASATTGTLSFTSTAGLNTALGNYPIIGSGLSAANYDFVQDAANSTALTITASTDATLANLTVDQGTLNPVFSSSQTSYGFSVANNVTSFNLIATVNQQNATLQFTGGALTSGITKNVPLNTGNNNFNIIVTAQDGSTTKYYTLNIFRAYDTNNLLASLNLGGVTYSPAFDAGTLNYTATVSNVVTSTDVTATAVSPTTHIFVGGYDLATTNPVNTALNVGETEVSVVSKAENGDEKVYRVVVTRAQSADATLTSIGNSSIALNTPFISSTHSYSATVATGVGVLTFLPTSTNNAAIIKVNNQSLNTTLGNNVSLAFGANSVVVDVTSENGLNHISYVLNIYRLRSSNADLASLSFPFITSVNEEFNPNVLDYTATVADSTYTGIPLNAVSADENAIVKIDGTVVPRFANYTLPVHGGANTYHIVVTSQDTSSTKTYTLVLTRAGQAPPLQSPVANLLALNVSSGSSFSKNFNFSMGEELTPIYAPNNIASVRIFPVSENEVSTVTVNGVTVPYDTTTGLLPISLGDNVFTIVVTSEDGAHTKTYEVHVNRLPFADVTLASISINAGTLTPAFNAATRSYTVSVPNTVNSISVTPVATVGTAAIQIGATQISPANPTATVNLSEGPPTNIRVVVTAADGVTKQTYTISVTRLPSNNAYVSMALNTGTVLVRTTGTSTYNYTASVSAEVNSVRLRTIAQANAVIKVNGNVVTSGVLSDPIALGPDPTVINVSVTAQDGVTVNTYSIIINHAGSNNANASLVLNPAATLASTTGTSTYNYTTLVPAEVSSIRLKATAQQADAVIKINGNVVASGVLSDPIALSTDPTIINVSVTAQDGVTVNTYSITVNHIISSNANVSLVLNPAATLMSTTGTSTYNYKTSVSADISSIRLKATAQQADAVIKINGNVVASGEFSDPITLTTDPTVINVLVTAQDGVTVNTYSITVNRTGSNNANVSLALNPAATLMSTTGTSTYNYKTSVSADISSIRLKATAQQVGAVIKINGNVVVSGELSDPIALTTDPTIVNVSVTAQDGVTINTYSITVNRTGSNNAYVSLTLNPVSTLTSATGTSTYNYTTSVSAGVNSVRLKAVAQQADAVIKVNGNVVASGMLSDPIALIAASTVINVSVTAQDGVTVNTYSITVNRSGSSNVSASLALNPVATLTAVVTGPGNVNYAATVGEGQSTIRVIPTVYDNATVTVNGLAVTGGTASDPIALAAGSSTLITVVVTGENGTTIKTYTINVSRPSSLMAVNRDGSKLLFANKTANNVAPTGDDGVVVHQGVSPNGDGSNDFLYIEGISAYAGNKLSIMNTSGTLVFETKDYGKDGSHTFDGHSNKTGALLKPGTYFYALEYQVDKQNKRKTGYIVIKY